MLLNPRSRLLVSRFAAARRNFCYPMTPTDNTEQTFALIKPDVVGNMGPILEVIHEEGFEVSACRMTSFSVNTAKAFYSEHIGKDFFPYFLEFATSGPLIGLRLARLDAISQWRRVCGPTNSPDARKEAPESIRARFGTDNRLNAVHGSDSEASAVRENNFFFGARSMMKRYGYTLFLLGYLRIQFLYV